MKRKTYQCPWDSMDEAFPISFMSLFRILSFGYWIFMSVSYIWTMEHGESCPAFFVGNVACSVLQGLNLRADREISLESRISVSCFVHLILMRFYFVTHPFFFPFILISRLLSTFLIQVWASILMLFVRFTDWIRRFTSSEFLSRVN